VKNGTFATVAYMQCLSRARRRSGRVTSVRGAYRDDDPKNYGYGPGPVWLYNLQCTGSELSIADCPHGGWSSTRYCSFSMRDVAIICSNGKLMIGSCSKSL